MDLRLILMSQMLLDGLVGVYCFYKAFKASRR